MRIALFGHDLQPWFKQASARLQANEGRGGVSWHEKLLLTGLLLVVAGWIILRVLQSLLAAA
jgi:hypothetical protein